MMSAPEVRREARLRRAYEIGRLSTAMVATLPIVPVLAVAPLCCRDPRQVIACGVALLAVVIGLRWRGQQYAVGVSPGLLAGLGPLFVPVAGRVGLPLCGVSGCGLTPAVCALGGLAGGIMLGLLAPRLETGRSVPFVVACVVAALTGAVGCLMYGLIGLVVMAGGLLIGALPLLAVRRA